MRRYKYSGRKSKLAPKGDFRTHKPRVGTVRGGYAWIQTCESFEGGRWEGFVSIRSRVYKTKSEAIKHRPKW